MPIGDRFAELQRAVDGRPSSFHLKFVHISWDSCKSLSRGVLVEVSRF
jgi:hypothetical protein